MKDYQYLWWKFFNAGIVGGGIGGTSTAYFLRQLFGKDAKIDIFEKRQVGGRLATIKIGDNQIEAGGTLIHPKNMYMVNFTKLLGKFLTSICSYYRQYNWNWLKVCQIEKKRIIFFLILNVESKIFVVYLNMSKYVLKFKWYLVKLLFCKNELSF